jgi:hypothetical protein
MDRLPQSVSAENRNTTTSEILSELRALRMRVDEMESEEPEEKPAGILGALLNNEAAMNTLVSSVAGIAAAFMNKLAIKPINNTTMPINGIDHEPTEQQKINKAIEVLSKNDPNLGDHLLILAKMSIDNPSQFTWLLGMLK